MTEATAREALNQIRSLSIQAFILPAVPAVPLREIVVIGLSRGAWALKLAALFLPSYTAKGDWQAHPA
jgi:hypothetical protein